MRECAYARVFSDIGWVWVKNLEVVTVDGVVLGFLIVNVPVKVIDMEFMSIARSLVVMETDPDK